MILAGDIGGTKTRLAFYRDEDGRLVRGEMEEFASQKAAGLPELVREFLCKKKTSVQSACFGAPGPVFAGEVDPTNLEWDVSEREMREVLGISAVRVVNDLAATAAAIPHLEAKQVLTLYEGKPTQSMEKRYVVLALGTGLGQAFLVIRDGESLVFSSEGGHVDFPPTTPIQVGLLNYLMDRFPRVSYERVLSGPGLENIYDFLRDVVFRQEPDKLVERFRREDRAKAISEAGLERRHAIAVQAVDIFATILGSYAGNLALTFRANSGVYLGGGIPPKMISKLKEGMTITAYLKKERMADLVAEIPLRVILDDHAALIGAASMARELLKL